MKPCNQTRNHCSCINGWTLPVGVLYGNVAKRYYVYNPLNAVLTVWNGKSWKRADVVSNAHIMHYITIFMKSQDFRMPEKIEVCAHITNLKNAEFSARKEDERFLRSISPREKRAQNTFTRFTDSCYSQSAVDGKGYSNAWEENHVIDGIQVDAYRKKVAVDENGGSFGYVVENRPALRADDPNRNFYENAEGKYVTITKRDGMSVDQVKAYREYHKNNTPEPTITQRYAEKAAEIRANRETPEYERYSVKRVASARKRAEISAINYGKRAIPV